MRKKILFICVGIMMLVMCTTVYAYDYSEYAIYKSSYVMAGYSSGVGSLPSTGEKYGFYGGLIPGCVDMTGCTVRGAYRQESGLYIISYQVQLSAPVDEYTAPICYIPIAYDSGSPISVSYTIMPEITGLTGSAPLGPIDVQLHELAQYTGTVTLYGLHYVVEETLPVPESLSYTATVDSGLAIPIVSTNSDADTYTVTIKVSDPDAEIQYPYEPDDRNFILNIIHFLDEEAPIIMTYASWIVDVPIVSVPISVAASTLLMSVVIGFMK